MSRTLGKSRCDACGAAYNGCPMHQAGPALLAACELALARLIRLDAEHLGPDPVCEAIRAAVAAARGE